MEDRAELIKVKFQSQAIKKDMICVYILVILVFSAHETDRLNDFCRMTDRV